MSIQNDKESRRKVLAIMHFSTGAQKEQQWLDYLDQLSSGREPAGISFGWGSEKSPIKESPKL